MTKPIFFSEYQPRTFADIFADTLARLGLKQLFGIPGGPISSLIYSISNHSELSIMYPFHETTAAYMAMGYTLSSPTRDQIGVCFTTAGPGLLNVVNGVASASEERVPILVVTGNVAAALRGKGAVQDSFDTGIDGSRIMSAICAESISVEHPDEVVSSILSLYQTALETRRPVHISLPADILGARVAQPMNYPLLPDLDRYGENIPLSFDIAIKKLALARRPLIFAGNGIKTAKLKTELLQFAETHQFPVVVTSHATGIFPQTHPLYVGNYGLGATDEAGRKIKQYKPDCLLILGSRMGELATGWSTIFSQPKYKIHVDIEKDQPRRVYDVDIRLPMRLETFFLKSRRGLTQHRGQRETGKFFHEKTEIAANSVPVCPAGPNTVHPAQIMDVLPDLIPQNGIIWSDIGNTMTWALNRLVLRGEQDFHVALGLGSMGSSIGSAIGSKLASPQRPVVALCGDCAALMYAGDFFSGRNVPIVFVVLNDQGAGMVDHGHRLLGLDNNVNVRLDKSPEFAELANALHLNGFRVTSIMQLMTLPWDKIWTSSSSTLIEVKIDGSIVPPIQNRAKVFGASESGGNNE